MDVTLHHYDVNCPVEVHVDASLHGLGGAHIQDGKPVAYATKALTTTHQCYANIERGLLATVFGVEHFHTCLWPDFHHSHRSQAPQADPAEDPCRCPVCLQQMFMCLQGYDCTISYCPGKKMLLADTLSSYAPVAAERITLDTAIHHVHIGTSCKALYQELTCMDPLLCTLAETIIASWPEDSKDVPCDLQDYWNHHDVMTVEDGIILWGKPFSSLQWRGRSPMPDP